MPFSNPSEVGVEAIAVMTGTFLSGAMMNLFLLTIPVLLETTQQTRQILHQWSRVYYNGHRKGPAISVTTGLIYACAAWSSHNRGAPWRIFAVAGITTVTMVPFTWVFMLKTNKALFRAESHSKNGESGDFRETVGLVKTWNKLNAVRALFPLTGAILGMLGVCKILLF